MSRPTLLSPDIEQALRLAAHGHRDQVRKGSGVPYIEHPMAVAWILDRQGFDEQVVVAGLLHDLVEDTEITLESIRNTFGDEVARLVEYSSETKLDNQGRKRPWVDRKSDHISIISQAPDEAKAVVLADKLHNLLSMQIDIAEGQSIWETFHADRDQVIAYYQAMIKACSSADDRVSDLAQACQDRLALVENLSASGIDLRLSEDV